ncbi:MAG: hypothetical protein WAT92_16930 [Saprospiraceae bacterium]
MLIWNLPKKVEIKHWKYLPNIPDNKIVFNLVVDDLGYAVKRLE